MIEFRIGLQTDPDGTIYNGASDNASGTAVVMEIVRLWHTQGLHPARSVVFAAWDGEEVGLKGARGYISTPIFPLERTIAVLNVDSVGVGANMYVLGESELVEYLASKASVFSIPVQTGEQNVGDGRPFMDENVAVPSVSILVFNDFEGRDFYPELHRPEDDPNIIQLDWLRSAGILASHSLYSLSMENN